MTRKLTALAKLMNQRGVSAAYVAAVTRLPVEDVEAWRAGDAEPDPDAAYLLDRALDGSFRAELAFEQLARRRTLSLSGEGAAVLGLKPTWPKDGTGVRDGGRVE